MEYLEFLEKSDRKNLKTRIGLKVKERLQQQQAEIEQRKQRLRELLTVENVCYDEELALFLDKKLKENIQKREEWIRSLTLERQKAHEEFVKLKQLQLELENCQEIRRLQSKQWLEETKRAQLYQINERKYIKRREQDVERMWYDILKRLDDEKTKHDVFERKLRKIIAENTQQNNLQQSEERKARQLNEMKSFQNEQQKDNERLIEVDNEWKKKEKYLEKYKQLKQSQVLKQQMEENKKLSEIQEDQKRKQENEERDNIFKAAQKDMEKQHIEKQNKREWNKNYLQHCKEEKLAMKERDKRTDDLVVGGECVLESRNKRPYGKNVR